MAAYPVTPVARKESVREPVKTRLIEHNDVGRIWVRDPGVVQLYTFKVFHPFITTAQKDAILTHWAGDKGNVFDFVWVFDGVTYQCVYGEAGRPKEQAITPTRWHVWTELASVA